jgi:hypothetical protein
MVEVDGAEPGRCKRDQADRIGAAAKRLKRPLDEPAVGRADDGRALLNQITEGAVVQADDLGSVWRRLAHRSRSESQAIEQREHPGASIRDPDRPRARLLGELPSGGTAGGGGPVGPVLPLSKRGGEDPSQEAIGARMPFVGDEAGGRKDEPRASWAIGQQGLSADHPRFAQHVEVDPDRIEMQADTLDELVNFQRSFGAKRLKQADPARAAQGTVRPPVERRQGWRNELGSRAHAV